MTTTINKVETNGTYSETEAKVFEIMEYLIGNVKASYVKPDSYWGEHKVRTMPDMMCNIPEPVDFIFDKDGSSYVTRTNNGKWTLVELFVRQYLNNGSDGFHLWNVEECFNYIMDNIDFIIEQDMISETGTNNSGSELWSNYRPEHPMVFNY